MRPQAEGRAWHETAGGLVIRFRLTPRAPKDAVGAVQVTAGGPAFNARVRAVPHDGAANRALEALVAEWLGMPQSRISVTAGAKSRIKSVMVAGDGAAIARLLESRSLAAERHGAQAAS